MIVNQYNTKKEHIKIAVLLISNIKGYNFHSRELALAIEFLHWAYLYNINPLQEIIEMPDGSKEVIKFDSVFDMVKYKSTLIKVCKSLDMSWTVLRKHTKNLKDKGFFKDNSFNKDFASVLDQSISINLVYQNV